MNERLVLLLVALAAFRLDALAWAGDDPIKSCFEGPARSAVDAASSDDELTNNLSEMAAGQVCNEFAVQVIGSCLAEVDAEESDSKDYNRCIGQVANTCIDSAFATTEFRKVVCIGTEEGVWIDLMHQNLTALKDRLQDEAKTELEAVENSFFEYRNRKCGLMRTVFEGSEPNVAYGACTTETVARFVIDLREMKIQATLRAQRESSEEAFPGTREGAEELLSRFLAEGADHRALTASLEPSLRDYALLFEEPLASRLRDGHAETWATIQVIVPERRETELRLVFSTTDRLATDEEVKAALPGGYQRVVPLMKPGVPFVTFKLVGRGEKLGKAYDGLVHLDGRWVLIPKPWRALEQ